MPSHFLAGQLTLSQPGGADYAHHNTTGTSGFSGLRTALLSDEKLHSSISVQSEKKGSDFSQGEKPKVSVSKPISEEAAAIELHQNQIEKETLEKALLRPAETALDDQIDSGFFGSESVFEGDHQPKSAPENLMDLAGRATTSSMKYKMKAKSEMSIATQDQKDFKHPKPNIVNDETSLLKVECHQSCALMKSLSENNSRRNSSSPEPMTFQELLQARRKLLNKYTPEDHPMTQEETEQKPAEWLLTRASIIQKDASSDNSCTDVKFESTEQKKESHFDSLGVPNQWTEFALFDGRCKSEPRELIKVNSSDTITSGNLDLDDANQDDHCHSTLDSGYYLEDFGKIPLVSREAHERSEDR